MKKNLGKIITLSAILVFALVGVLLFMQSNNQQKTDKGLLKTNTVSSDSSDKLTIYYSGFLNPYIHFAVGNNEWTEAPGVLMSATTDAYGYTHKFTINLSGSDTLTACFNDGLGTWDNNNGKNYTFNVGTYGVKNGVVSEVIDNSIEVTDLFSYNPSYHFVGGFVELRAYVKNQNGNVKYSFEVLRNGISKTIQFSYSNICIWVPESAGVYTVKVTAVDESYNYDSEIMPITITGEEFRIENLSSSSTNRMLTNTITTLSFDVFSGVESINTTLSINDVTVAINTNSIEWSPTAAGEYKITATSTDYYNCVASQTIYVTVFDNFEVTSIVSTLGNTLTVGNTTTLLAITNLMSNDLTYSIFVNDELVLDNSTSNAVSYTFNEAGNYIVQVGVVKDGNTYYNSTTINVTEENIVTIHYNGFDTPYCHYKIGDTWTNTPGVKMEESSNVIGYTHSITINLNGYSNLVACFNDGAGNWDSNNGNNYTFNKGIYGYYDGQIVNLNEDNIEIMSFYCYDSNYAFIGGLLEFRACATSNNGSVQYAFFKTVNGEEVCFQDYSSSEKGLLNVTEAGLHKITVRARDEKGNTCEDTLEVNIPSNTNITIYYSGMEADDVYIHYAINGIWTAVPGVKMNYDGSYHSITIAINEGDSFVCCFNNGNGLWDNNNGSNFTVLAGTTYIF